ncbi:MAG: hypothetical protein ACD_20C00437G0004 [uncultured bacterium]|nr:MAG: hypothetical protein ACD_20C00437G0004 [uncultured bacterium]
MGKIKQFFILILFFSGCTSNTTKLNLNDIIFFLEKEYIYNSIGEIKQKQPLDGYLYKIRKIIETMNFQDKKILALYIMTRLNLDAGAGETFVEVFKLENDMLLIDYLKNIKEKKLQQLSISSDNISQFYNIINVVEELKHKNNNK